MKTEVKLGVFGLGSFSTMYYLEQLNAKYHAKFGGYSTCPFLLINANFNEINPHLPDKFAEVEKAVLPYLQQCSELKISHLLVPNITLHQTLDLIFAKHHFDFSLIHPLVLAVETLQKNQIKEVAILGTNYTMNGAYIQNFLAEMGISRSLAAKPFHTEIDALRTAVYQGNLEKSHIHQDLKIVAENTTLLVACTELSVYFAKHPLPNLVDMAGLQLDFAVDLFG